jgi:hypothetical protein
MRQNQNQFKARRRADFSPHSGKVIFNRARRDFNFVRNSLVARAGCGDFCHFDFARSQREFFFSEWFAHKNLSAASSFLPRNKFWRAQGRTKADIENCSENKS